MKRSLLALLLLTGMSATNQTVASENSLEQIGEDKQQIETVHKYPTAEEVTKAHKGMSGIDTSYELNREVAKKLNIDTYLFSWSTNGCMVNYNQPYQMIEALSNCTDSLVLMSVKERSESSERWNVTQKCKADQVYPKEYWSHTKYDRFMECIYVMASDKGGRLKILFPITG